MDKEELETLYKQSEKKMQDQGCSASLMEAFKLNFFKLGKGEKGCIPEDHLDSIDQLESLDSLEYPENSSLLKEVVVVKLNGGLGTGMGLDSAKSLLQVKEGNTFLDFITLQILSLRMESKVGIKFLLMNSFSTSEATMQYLGRYQSLSQKEKMEFLQSKIPKLSQKNLLPARFKNNPALEWCPPGHGDIYISLKESGLLDELLDSGVKYMFVSNSDNLGATLDGRILTYFAKQGLDFMMEVCQRTSSDRKGGHLAKRKKAGLLLRETAQCLPEDEEAFQDIEKHSYFNTNNLWVRLEKLKETMEANGGILPLPLICNSKTVDPTDKQSEKVWQLEGAMGAAIECFDRSAALLVPRRRFAPVKTTSDLLVVRSDAYEITTDNCLNLAESCKGVPPKVELDSCYKLIADFESYFSKGVPSLKFCKNLWVIGKVNFATGVVIKGNVKIINETDEVKTLAAGLYRDQEITLS